MPEITLVRTDEQIHDESTREAARRFVFGLVKGCSERDDKAWRRFWRVLLSKEPGELVDFVVSFPRNSKFHRKFFALLNFAFECWEPDRKRKTYKGRPVLKNFDRFRKDVIIQAGFYEQTFDLSGKMVLEAQSIRFANMDDEEFEQVYSAVADVILDRVLIGYAGRGELDAVVEQVMGFR